MGDPPGHRFGITRAQQKDGLRDEFDVLGVGLREVQCAGTGCGRRVRRRRGVDGDPSPYNSAARLLVSRLSAALTVPYIPNPADSSQSANGGPGGRSPPTDVRFRTRPRPRSRMAALRHERII
jgi:hypothetical protein